MHPFNPSCNPIDPEGTAKLLDDLNIWFAVGGPTDDALAILDKMTTTAGTAFAAELTVHLAGVGLAHLHQIERRRLSATPNGLWQWLRRTRTAATA